MELIPFANSGSFFDVYCPAPRPSRLLCFKDFLKKCAVLPFALLYKLSHTFFRVLGVGLSGAFVLLTLGISEEARQFFVRRVIGLAKDLADWILYPLSVLACTLRLIIGCLFNPDYYFKF